MHESIHVNIYMVRASSFEKNILTIIKYYVVWYVFYLLFIFWEDPPYMNLMQRGSQYLVFNNCG